MCEQSAQRAAVSLGRARAETAGAITLRISHKLGCGWSAQEALHSVHVTLGHMEGPYAGAFERWQHVYNGVFPAMR